MHKHFGTYSIEKEKEKSISVEFNVAQIWTKLSDEKRQGEKLGSNTHSIHISSLFLFHLIFH